MNLKAARASAPPAPSQPPSDGRAAETPEQGAPALSIATLTPMMRQYMEAKAKAPGCLLFFRLGDFYEMFAEDAIKAAEVLQITLTSRSKGDDKVPMCGIPYHAVKGYIRKLIEQGFKVALCDQVEEPGSGKEIVKREITRIITPGMVLDDEVLEARENRFVAAVAFSEAEGQGGGMALLDASTGEFFAGTADSDDELAQEIARAHPSELLFPRKAEDSERARSIARACPDAVLNHLDDDSFQPRRAESLLCSHFGVRSLDGFGLAPGALSAGAAGAALRYLRDTQRSEASHVDRLSALAARQFLVMDESSRQNLEVVRTLRDGKRKGSLLGLLDRTATAMGGRRLSRWLLYPLLELKEIQRRLDAVAELSERGVLREETGALLKDVADLERLSARLCLGQGNARDLRALGTSLAKLPEVSARVGECSAPMLRERAPALLGAKELGALLLRAVADEPAATLKEGGMIRAGYSAELDKLQEASTSGKDFLLRLEAEEKSRTGIASLKVRYNRVFGYYIEITKANLHLVPKDYIRKQTTVGAERFVTEKLKEFEELVLTAEEKRCALELKLFEELRAKVVAASGPLRQAADGVADVDALLAFARCAAEYGYVRPEVDESDVIEISEGRHPVVERLLAGEAFVPNDMRLDEAQQILVITGPNMAGKSTVMRQVALTVLMAQAGCFVPARRARIGLCDRIFTRVGASDNLARGQSTFMVEMTETANILHNATRRSLVILDEIGRGTSTFDGLSIAWAVAEHLHDKSCARTLFATHYHELTELCREKPRVKNATIAVKEWQGKIIFLRKLVAGGASRSYGIEVARLAGLPAEVVRRARQILKNLESGELDEAGRPTLLSPLGRKQPEAQLGLFVREALAVPNTLLEDLKALEPESMTPLQALSALDALVRKARAG